jgi:serine acetyltransferase
VWIGASAIILPRVSKIGNGAIIGAGSIVTKDVLPYAIVAGNPAKIMRMRFNKDIIKKLEESKWWELDKKRLIENKQYFEEIIKCIENQNP